MSQTHGSSQAEPPEASATAEAPSSREAPRGPEIRELTLRGILIGGIITLVFTAANVYLGLKAGLTFATSIPAAVISMALLHRFRDHSVVENNIVQTIASSAGTLAAIIFVLPGLIMVGWWSDFPYWITVAVCVVGGILGVMYSIPLRRALVTHSDLPYPEGVAAAEVLRLGDTDAGQESNRAGMRTIIWGGVASAGYAILTKLRVVADSFTGVFRIGAGGTMISGGLSLALLGVGHLVGLGVGIAMLVGMAISYGVAMPVVSAGRLEGQPLSDALSAVFSSDVRYIGAGAIAVAAVWTLLKIIGPIVLGIKDSLVSARTRRAGGTVDITGRDIPMPLVILTIAALESWSSSWPRCSSGPSSAGTRTPSASRRWSPTRCSRPPWSSPSRRSPTTASRTPRPASWSAPPSGGSRSLSSSASFSGRSSSRRSSSS